MTSDLPSITFGREATSFAINLLLCTGFTETIKILEMNRLEGQQLLAEYKASHGSMKEDIKTAISAGIEGRKMLESTLFMHVLEKDA